MYLIKINKCTSPKINLKRERDMNLTGKYSQITARFLSRI